MRVTSHAFRYFQRRLSKLTTFRIKLDTFFFIASTVSRYNDVSSKTMRSNLAITRTMFHVMERKGEW
jgi:hypothetical protein